MLEVAAVTARAQAPPLPGVTCATLEAPSSDPAGPPPGVQRAMEAAAATAAASVATDVRAAQPCGSGSGNRESGSPYQSSVISHS